MHILNLVEQLLPRQQTHHTSHSQSVLIFKCWFSLSVFQSFHVLFTFSEAPGAEARHGHSYSNGHSCNICRHTQSHCWFAVRPGNPQHQGGAVHQDGRPRHIPAEQELPAVIRHLGEAGSTHTRCLIEECSCWQHISRSLAHVNVKFHVCEA